MKIKHFLITISLIAVTSTFAWDGKRQGILLGTGVGASSISNSSTEAKNDGDWLGATYNDVMFQTLLGYAWNNKNAVYFQSSSLGSHYDLLGLVYHSWKSEAAQSNSWFIGLQKITYTPNRNLYLNKVTPTDAGLALAGGYGFEFAPHVDLQLNLLLGAYNAFDASYNQLTESWSQTSGDARILLAFSVSVNVMGY